MNAPPRDIPLPQDEPGPPRLAADGIEALPATTLPAAEIAALAMPLPRSSGTLLRHPRHGVLAAACPADHGTTRDLRLWFANATVPLGLQRGLKRRLDALARREGATTLRLQQKTPTDGALAAMLPRLGFAPTEPSIAHELDVERAGAVLDRLAFPLRRLGSLTPGTLCPATVETVRAVLEHEQLMDGFELDARRGRTGPGAVVLAESPAVFDGAEPVGFILVARTETPATRELVARWVREDVPARSLVNLALMRDCVARARSAGISAARFRANPARHADTMALARRIAAREVDRLVGFERRLAPSETA